MLAIVWILIYRCKLVRFHFFRCIAKDSNFLGQIDLLERAFLGQIDLNYVDLH